MDRSTRAVPFLLICLAVGMAAIACRPPVEDATSDGEERRVALVIGNAAYLKSPLDNSVSDAEAVAAALADVGFSVTTVEDATQQQMGSAIAGFVDDLRPDDVAMFYYAGHGVQVGNENYLIPTDYAGTTETEVQFGAHGVTSVLDKMSAARVAILVFDACRNNPYRGIRGAAGLAAMNRLARGTLVMYSASAGAEASDEGLFAARLVEALRQPELGISELFQRVQNDVESASNGRQRPALYDELVNDFVLRLEDPVEEDAEVAEVAADGPFRDCPTCPEMMRIPSGRFMMGSNEGDERERPVHPVTVGSFAIGRHEVTRVEFAAFLEATGHRMYSRNSVSTQCHSFISFPSRRFEQVNPPYNDGRSWGNPGFAQNDAHPVVCVSWADAQRYVRWLRELTGMTYRLPSEAEWEYAARAGTTTERYWGDDSDDQCTYGNGADRTLMETRRMGHGMVISDRQSDHAACLDRAAATKVVGWYVPNRFKLHDMLGNVSEWVQDGVSGSYRGAPRDGTARQPIPVPLGPGYGRPRDPWGLDLSVFFVGEVHQRSFYAGRMVRGGSWLDGSDVLRSASRAFRDGGDRFNHIGFRVVRDLD